MAEKEEGFDPGQEMINIKVLYGRNFVSNSLLGSKKRKTFSFIFSF